MSLANLAPCSQAVRIAESVLCSFVPAGRGSARCRPLCPATPRRTGGHADRAGIFGGADQSDLDESESESVRLDQACAQVWARRVSTVTGLTHHRFSYPANRRGIPILWIEPNALDRIDSYNDERIRWQQ